MSLSFWSTLPRPILGISPMDGITDPAFRSVTDHIGHPSVLFTEFASADGLERGVPLLFRTFIHHKTQTPLVGQLFGADPETMYSAALILCELGMDGIDINMGCPNRHVVYKGGGAALIRQPTLAKDIVVKVKQAVADWNDGLDVTKFSKYSKLIETLQHARPIHPVVRRSIPVSLKTRIGYDSIQTIPWISTLLTTEPATISLHGRLFTQEHAGPVQWEEVAKASALCTSAGVTLLGNGSVYSHADALAKSAQYCPDGVLIGRGMYGNPWIFSMKTPSFSDRIDAALYHMDQFELLTPTAHVLSLRKHLGWYIKGVDNATNIRIQIMKVTTLDQAREIFIKLKQVASS